MVIKILLRDRFEDCYYQEHGNKLSRDHDLDYVSKT